MRIALLAAGLLAAPLHAQTPTPVTSPDTTAAVQEPARPYRPRLIRVDNGVGIASRGVAFEVSASYRTSPGRFVMARVAGEEEFALFGPSPPASALDAGVLYGHVSERRGRTLTVAAGLAAVRVVRRGVRFGGGCDFSPIPCGADYERLTTWTVGIPVSAQVHLTPIRYVGLSVHAFGDLNMKAPFAGLAIGVMFGG